MKDLRPWVYCAGKIDLRDWRHYLIEELERVPFGELRDGPGFLYCGPYFLNLGGHGQVHGQRVHAMVVPEGYGPNYDPDAITRDAVPGLCHDWLSRADMVFAWIDCTDCFGTLIELGWAVEQKKPVYIAFANYDLMKEMWFLTKCRNVHSQVHDSPTVALGRALLKLGTVHRTA